LVLCVNETDRPAYSPAPPADFVLPFDLGTAHLRGRFVRLEQVVTRAAQSHPLPEAAERVLGEAMALAALLGSALKLEGRLSVQTQSKGALNPVVADYFAGGGLRGYARCEDKAPAPNISFAELAGEGVLAITIDPKPGAATYQGIVSLSPTGLAASAETYFAQSEQLPTILRLAAAPSYREGVKGWSAGGLMVQAIPGKGDREVSFSDDWRRIEIFMQSLEDYELLDASIAAETILWRLFHKDEVRVTQAQSLHFQCGCDPSRILGVLKAYPASELAELADDDGFIRARCEFCGARYEFPLGSALNE
jgi:molecular chaperone Hsp33